MTNDKPYILFCAGEDSGDVLGESLLRSAVKIVGDKLSFIGSGGSKMASAGLKSLVNYEVLPVSGFGDVLPRYFRLRSCFSTLENALRNPRCKGLVAIDYPGFNMKLTALANRMHKPVLYVAPPQAWAWKPHRARKLSHPENTLAFFFDFEEEPYRNAGCNVVRMQHPLITNFPYTCGKDPHWNSSKKTILLLPGSRKSQAFRNLPFFLETVRKLDDFSVVLVLSRKDLLQPVKNFVESKFGADFWKTLRVEFAPDSIQERLNFYSTASIALSCPGTATLELAFSGCRTVVCTKPDFLTYNLGKRLIKTSWFALPNLILGKELFPEFIVGPGEQNLQSQVRKSILQGCENALEKTDVDLLWKKLRVGKNSEELMSEFLAQFLKG